MRILVVAVAVLSIACGRRASDLQTFNTVPDFTMTAETGEEFRSAEALAGHVWVADFIFTTCTGPCPRMSARMRRLQNDLADYPDVRFVSFTVDPENDTPEALAEYGERFGADQERWRFLTGSMEDLHQLNRHAFMLGDVKGNLDHSTRFVLVDRAGVVRGYYVSGDSEAMDRLLADARLLAEEDS